MKQTAAWLEEDLESLYKRVGWPLGKEFGTIHEAFMKSLSDPEAVFSKVDIDEKAKQLLMDNISKRMQPMSYKVCATFEISCFTFEGIDAVKRALTAVEENKEFEIAIRLISSPLYEIATHTPKTQQGIEAVSAQLEQIEKNILERKGMFKIKDKPSAIGAKEEEDVENMIRNLNNQADDDNSSQNREDNDEEGMNVQIEGYDDSELPSSTTATEENKDNSEESDEDQ